MLIAGDMLADLEIPWLDREPAAYRQTLRALLALAEAGAVETLIPGHSSIARGAEVLGRMRQDLGYLDAIEDGVRAARADGLTLAGAQERLAAMEFTGKGAAMDAVHRENVRFAWPAATG